MKKLSILILIWLSAFHLKAQPIPVIIQGATIHVGNGTVIEKGFIVLLEGKIVSCAKELTTFYKNARVIDATGKHVYPGIIAMNNYAGLNEIDAIRATRDYNEVGSVNPNARSLIAYNTDSKILPTLTFNGIAYTQCVPQGGLISGSSSVMKTEGWNWEDAVVLADDGVHINWPEFEIQTGWWAEPGETQRNRTEKQLTEISDFMKEASRYASVKSPSTVNLRLEAMKGVMSGKKNLYLHINGAKGIMSAIQFMNQYPLVKPVLVGAAEAWKVADLIKSKNIPVVLNQLHRLPQRAYDDIDLPYKTPALLMQKGIKVAIGHNGSWEVRNLMFNAGTAVAYGLSEEEALMCITKIPAEIMGISNQYGTLETGKMATVVISAGDLLDMRGNQIENMFIDGVEANLENQQLELYQRYMKKYGLK